MTTRLQRLSEVLRTKRAAAGAFIRQKSANAWQYTKAKTVKAWQVTLDGIDRGLQRIDQRIDQFDQVLREGEYHSDPTPSLVGFIRGKKRDTPNNNVSLVLADNMVGTTKTVGKRLLWTSIFALAATKVIIWAGIGIGALGYAVFARMYSRAKKSREETIREVNFAGQTVEGKRADLCRLHQAQVRIMNLADNFRQASMNSTSQTIREIMASVAEESARVKVIDTGKYSKKYVYDFSEPAIKLVNEDQPDGVMTLSGVDDVVREVNFAGQTVEGYRSDLYRLYTIQSQILNLRSQFNAAANDNAQASHEHAASVDTIIASAQHVVDRVRVIDAGQFGASADKYQFADHVIGGGNLKSGFDAAKDRDFDALAERLSALEKILSPDVIEKAQKQAGQNNRPQA